MVRRETKSRIIALGISLSLIALVVFILTPPAMAVYVAPGSPSPTSGIDIGDDVTFTDVNFTIRNAERIIVNYLQFTIYDSDDDQVAYVRFRIDGTETVDGNSRFTVTPITNTSNLPYTTGGSSYGYDEITAWNASTYGYGYGYNGTGLVDLTILYTIVYTTHTAGTFYAKLLVNSSIHDYVSDESATFTVDEEDSGDDDGGGGGGGSGTGGDDEEEGTTTSDDNVNDINEEYGLDLDEPFYSNDTDGDGIDDTFTDPNGVLKNVQKTTIGGNSVFLISTGDDSIPEFYWDPVTDTITPITHAPPTATTSETDYEEETITVTATVTKEDGWIYIDIEDEYPDFNLTVKNSAGEEISSDKIWRENGRVYVLDDPDENYLFIYGYTLLPPTFSPADGTTFNSSKPTITITYVETVTITDAKLNQDDITLYTEDFKIYTFTPEANLSEDAYILSITVRDEQGNSLTSTYTFNVDLPEVKDKEKPDEGISLPIIIAIIIIIIIIIIVFLFKSGYLYIEEVEEEEGEVEELESDEEEPEKETKEKKEPETKKKSQSKKTKKK